MASRDISKLLGNTCWFMESPLLMSNSVGGVEETFFKGRIFNSPFVLVAYVSNNY